MKALGRNCRYQTMTTGKGIIMKKLIALIVAVVVIWVVLKMIGVDLSVSLSPDKNEASKKKRLTPNYIIGEYMPSVLFPESATDIHMDIWSEVHNKSFWIVAKLPKEDFYNLVEQLKLTPKPDLLEFWPKALSLEQRRIVEFWDITKQSNEDTYYGEHTEVEASAAAKYENGKIYFRTKVSYVITQDENGQYRYAGRKKRQK